MKSILIASGIFMGTLVSLAYATESQQQSVPAAPSALAPATSRDDGGHTHHYHYSHGQELFSGDEWLLAVPLLLIPIIALGCWYMWGGKDDGYGWDRMGYTDSSNYNTQGSGGAYESRMFRGADALDKRTHQRIFNAIQQ